MSHTGRGTSEGRGGQRRLHEVVPEPVPLGSQVTAVAVVRCNFERRGAGYRDAGRGEAGDFGEVVAEQVDAVDTEVAEDGCGVGVVAGVDGQPELQVGVDGVEAQVVPELVGCDFRGQSDAAAFVTVQVQQHPSAGVGDAFECGGALCAAVAAP